MTVDFREGEVRINNAQMENGKSFMWKMKPAQAFRLSRELNAALQSAYEQCLTEEDVDKRVNALMNEAIREAGRRI